LGRGAYLERNLDPSVRGAEKQVSSSSEPISIEASTDPKRKLQRVPCFCFHAKVWGKTL